jgi:uncharacterized repeat protein (TIGR02543 family)
MKKFELIFIIIMSFVLAGSAGGAIIYYNLSTENPPTIITLDPEIPPTNPVPPINPNPEPITHTVQFVTNGGEAVNEKTVAHGEKVYSSPYTARTGYTFENWYKEPNFLNAWNFFADTITTDTTLYARWGVNKYNLRYEILDGVWKETKFQSYQNVNFGTKISRPQNPERMGFGFDNWYTNEDCQVLYEFDGQMPAYTVAIYAKWNQRYTVTLDTMADGLSFPDIIQGHNFVINLPNDLTRPHYEFSGWFDAPTDGNQVSMQYTITESVTLYARWTPNTYTITFNPSGGNPVSPITNAYLAEITEPQTQKAGFGLLGWYTQLNGGERVNFPYTILGNATLFAEWGENCTIVFDPQNGEPLITISNIPANTQINAAAPPQIPEWATDFTGWSVIALNGACVNFPYTVTASLTLYAQYEKIEYLIRFMGNGGNPSTTIKYCGFGEPIYAPATNQNPTRTGHSFSGWYTLASGGTKVTFPINAQGDTFYYAGWMPNSYQISFDANGGTPSTYVTGVFGTSLSAPANPTRTNFKFLGWSTSAQIGGYIQNFPITVAAGNVTYYAEWRFQFPTPTSVSGNISLSTVNSNYAHNSAIEQPVGFIEAQSQYSNWWYDGSTLNKNGCGIIGIYNAFFHLGVQFQLAELIRHCEATGGTAGNYMADKTAGISDWFDIQSFGTVPYYIKNVANLVGINCSASSSMSANQAMTITFWNEEASLFGLGLGTPNMAKGAHTVCVTKNSNGTYTAHNRSGGAITYNSISAIYSNGLLFTSGNAFGLSGAYVLG